MLFGVPVYGGAKFDEVIHYDFTLHDVQLSYDIPGGVWGTPTPDEFKRVINYRLDDENFESNWRDTKRNYYQLNSAVWNYYARFPLFRLFPENEIGDLIYDIGINQLPEGIEGKTNKGRTENFIWSFLKQFLEGEDGVNTKIRDRNTDIPDDKLPEGYWDSLIVPMPEKLQSISVVNEWLYFELSGRNFHKETHYYFTPLNSEYALSIEFTPHCNRTPGSRAGKYINQMHEKTIQMIMNSIRLDFD